MDLQQKITEALEEHLVVTQQLTAMSHLILQVASEVVATLRRQGKVVLCGNGGSASDAQHIAAEMQGIRTHPGTPQGLLALVLTENTALFTAISNDVGYPAAFRRKEALLTLVNTALLCTLDPEQIVVDIEQAGEAEIDEMWSFVGNKGNPRWLWHAIDHHTGAVLAYVFGRRKDEVFLRLKALLEPFGLTRFYTNHWGLTPDIWTLTCTARGNGTPKRSSVSI